MEIAPHEKRVFPRKPIHGRGELVDPLSGSKDSIDLVDISAGGVSFLSQTPRGKDSMWLVRFRVDDKKVHGLVRIAYCLKHSLADSFRMGAEFRDWERVNLETVQDFLNQS